MDPNHLKDISETYSKLVKKADQRRLVFLRLLIVIYTPVTSGLFYINLTQEVKLFLLYFAVLFSSAFVVLLSLLTYLGYMLTSEDVAKFYVEKINETGKHYNKPLYGKRKNTRLITESTTLAIIMLIVNIVSILAYSVAYRVM